MSIDNNNNNTQGQESEAFADCTMSMRLFSLKNNALFGPYARTCTVVDCPLMHLFRDRPVQSPASQKMNRLAKRLPPEILPAAKT